jgi:hypothetical protein
VRGREEEEGDIILILEKPDPSVIFIYILICNYIFILDLDLDSLVGGRIVSRDISCLKFKTNPTIIITHSVSCSSTVRSRSEYKWMLSLVVVVSYGLQVKYVSSNRYLYHSHRD